MWDRLPLRLKGYLITGTGVLMLSPDALFVKDTDVELATFMFWRALLLGSALLLIALLRYRRELPAAIRRCGLAAWVCPMAIACGAWSFVAANRLTAAGNVLVIQNLAPLVAGLIGLIFFGQRLRLQTWCVILLCVIGAGLMVAGELGGGNPLGLIIALALPLAMALNTTVASAQRGVDTTVILPIACLLMLLPAIALGGATLPQWHDMQRLLLLSLFFLPCAYFLIQSGPRYLPGAEVSLMILLETLLGTLLVWWWIGELPTRLAFIGGGLILSVLAGSALLDLYRLNRRTSRGAPDPRELPAATTRPDQM